MKIIFLDNDGVICLSTEWGKRFKKFEGLYQIFDPFNKGAVNVLNKILKETDAEIVVSSDWKFHATLEQLGEWYEKNGIIKKPIDTTSKDRTIDPNFPYVKGLYLEQIRTIEIKKWMKEHPEVTHWVAVDDMDLGINSHNWGLTNFVHTPRSSEGIKQCGVKEKILKFLKDS